MKSVELFAGAGGLAMGAHMAGFRAELLVEWDKWACETIRRNKDRGHKLVCDWNIYEGDVRVVDWRNISGPIALVSGGPPCQPFSLGGKHLARDDKRDMFPHAVEVVRKLTPKAFIFENVKGLTRTTFSSYFEYILLQLQLPEIVIKKDEGWEKHWRRLKKCATGLANCGLTYQVSAHLANAADYGVPQRRERVFIVGFRSDLSCRWSFPKPTHSRESLLYEQYVSKSYWDRHKISRAKASVGVIRQMRTLDMLAPSRLPWVTVRDALGALPTPHREGDSKLLNHVLQEGARTYVGHTGSPLDLPAKTLKAGGHGVPGGENMLVNDDGSVRYFTVREAARLQTFPDNYELHGSWGETMRQLGNAVPVHLANVVASTVYSALLGAATSPSDTSPNRRRQVSRELSGVALQSARQREPRR